MYYINTYVQWFPDIFHWFILLQTWTCLNTTCYVIEKRIYVVVWQGSHANHMFYFMCKLCYFVIWNIEMCIHVYFLYSVFKVIQGIQWKENYVAVARHGFVLSIWGVVNLTYLSTIGLASYQFSTPLVKNYQTQYSFCNILFPIRLECRQVAPNYLIMSFYNLLFDKLIIS